MTAYHYTKIRKKFIILNVFHFGHLNALQISHTPGMHAETG